MNFKAEQAISSLEYNSLRKDLIIPEYGRHLQKLVDQMVAIEDREEETKLQIISFL